jgi:hypothetical protein
MAHYDRRLAMLEYLSANWVWMLLVGAMLWMHLGHGGHGGHGGCGGHQSSKPTQSSEQTSRPHDHQHQK